MTKESRFSPRKKLRALQFNVWLDGTRVRDGLSLIANTIIESDADIISLVEVKNLRGDFVQKLKKKLEERGVVYYGSFVGNPRKFGLDADTCILSRYPVTQEKVVYRTRENCIVRSMIHLDGDSNDGGNTVAVYSVHLEYRCYSCYLPRGYNSHSEQFPGWGIIGRPTSWFHETGWFRSIFCSGKEEKLQPVTDVEVVRKDNIASTRPHAISLLIDDAQSLEESNVPIIIMGDLNEPSTLDWTEETSDLADHNGLVYNWDTTELLKQSGFVDAYREVYPNPATHPGFTWPAAAQGADDEKPKMTNWIKMADERDRLDYIFFKGQLKPVNAWLVGTPACAVRDEFINQSEMFQDKFSYSIGSPWPSDHRAVMAVFEMNSAPSLRMSCL